MKNTQPQKYRTERDAIGEKKVPVNAYSGIFTSRAQENFQISGQQAHPKFILALGKIKEAAAKVNAKLGVLDPKLADVIAKAAREFGEGKFYDEIGLDVIQAGAGTPFNMNSNEIIANRANELLGSPRGIYKPIHPNNHVNASQSSNDVIPTAIRIGALFLIEPLLVSVADLAESFEKIAQKYKNVIKVGRTHLEDAVPMTVGQEFGAFATQLKKTHTRLAASREELREIGLGGTALGSGITTDPAYQTEVAKMLTQLTGLPLCPTKDLFETTSSLNPFVAVSSVCRMLAIDLVKIANDLKLLNMGPLAGIAEITLPEVEPGSSIMPGKVNPSIAEAVHIAAYDAMASDTAVALAAQAGQLQLNVMTPLLIKHLLPMLDILRRTCDMFRVYCVDGIVMNTKTIAKLFEQSLVTATALSPYLGYEVTAELVKEGLSSGRSMIDVVRSKKFMDEADLKKLLSPAYTTKPAKIDAKLKGKILGSKKLQAYKKSLK